MVLLMGQSLALSVGWENSRLAKAGSVKGHWVLEQVESGSEQSGKADLAKKHLE